MSMSVGFHEYIYQYMYYSQWVLEFPGQSLKLCSRPWMIGWGQGLMWGDHKLRANHFLIATSTWDCIEIDLWLLYIDSSNELTYVINRITFGLLAKSCQINLCERFWDVKIGCCQRTSQYFMSVHLENASIAVVWSNDPTNLQNLKKKIIELTRKFHPPGVALEIPCSTCSMSEFSFIDQGL